MPIKVKILNENKINEMLDIPPEVMDILTPENITAIVAMLGVSVVALKSALSSVLGKDKSDEEIALGKAMKGISSGSPELSRLDKSRSRLNKKLKKVGMEK